MARTPHGYLPFCVFATHLSIFGSFFFSKSNARNAVRTKTRRRIFFHATKSSRGKTSILFSRRRVIKIPRKSRVPTPALVLYQNRTEGSCPCESKQSRPQSGADKSTAGRLVVINYGSHSTAAKS